MELQLPIFLRHFFFKKEWRYNGFVTKYLTNIQTWRTKTEYFMERLCVISNISKRNNMWFSRQNHTRVCPCVCCGVYYIQAVNSLERDNWLKNQFLSTYFEWVWDTHSCGSETNRAPIILSVCFNLLRDFTLRDRITFFHSSIYFQWDRNQILTSNLGE